MTVISQRENFRGRPATPRGIARFSFIGNHIIAFYTKIVRKCIKIIRIPVNTLVAVADDPKLIEMRRIIDRFTLSRRPLAIQVGLAPTTLDYWYKTQGATIRDMPKLNALLGILREKEAYLSPNEGSSTNSGVREHNSPYSVNDPALLERIRLLSTVTEFTAWLPPMNEPWSVRTVMKKIRNGSTFPAASGQAVQLTDSLGYLRQGAVLIFKPKDQDDDFAPENIYLLFENKEDPDMRILGWLDPEVGGIKIKTLGSDYPLSEWKVTHFAFSVMWGSAGTLTESRSSDAGIGPLTRP